MLPSAPSPRRGLTTHASHTQARTHASGSRSQSSCGGPCVRAPSGLWGRGPEPPPWAGLPPHATPAGGEQAWGVAHAGPARPLRLPAFAWPGRRRGPGCRKPPPTGVTARLRFVRRTLTGFLPACQALSSPRKCVLARPAPRVCSCLGGGVGAEGRGRGRRGVGGEGRRAWAGLGPRSSRLDRDRSAASRAGP